MQCNCKCSSLVTSFPSHQVSIFTCTHSIPLSAFSFYNLPPFVTSHQHGPHHGYYAVGGVVWRRQPSNARKSAPAPDKISRKGGKGEILWARTCPTVSSRPRGRCVQSLVPIGSEMWICIRYKQTNIQTFIFIYKKR